jgi:hypothetical protein
MANHLVLVRADCFNFSYVAETLVKALRWGVKIHAADDVDHNNVMSAGK